ncbi:MAG: site-2 protease family protein [Dehalococcoidales bacterium]|nr:site-2 protease family protein [Dehalococcoidales bacterium]
MGKSFNLGKVFGIQLRLHFTWSILFIFLTGSLVYPNWSQWFYWVAGIVASLLFFSSVVAHELAHSLVGRANGIPIKSITLFIFGGVAQMTKEPADPSIEFKVAVAGPACSLAIGGIFFLFWWLTQKAIEPIAAILLWLAIINLALVAFNMIPGFPLDGGRVFRSLLWRVTGNYRRSTRIATQVGRAVGYAFIVGGILIVLLRPFGLNWFSGLWFVFIGWFLEHAAASSYRQVR